MSILPINPEKDLLIKVANGDEEAFKQLFNQYRHKIYSLSMYLTHSEFLAEEITQEVFLKIWLSKAQLKDVEYFTAYLKTIASNVASNFLKRLANEKIILKKLADEMTESNETTDHTVIYNEYQDILEKAIQNLPPQQKRVYLLSRQEGLKQEEIAEKMQLSIFTVKEYMKKALSSIRSYMGNRIDLAIFLAIQIYLGK